MKTIREQIAVMQHFADGGKVKFKRIDGDRWGSSPTPAWNWMHFDYCIEEEVDPYAELKKAAADPTKQIRCGGTGWYDCGEYKWLWKVLPEDYEIRDKPKPMKKVKLLAWLTEYQLFWLTEEPPGHTAWKRVPSEDKEIEVADD